MSENINNVSNTDTTNQDNSNQPVISKYIYTGVDKFQDVIEAYIGQEIGKDYAKEIADGDEVDTQIIRKEILDAIEQTYYALGKSEFTKTGKEKKVPLYRIPNVIPDTVIEQMAIQCGKFATIRTANGKLVLAVHYSSGQFEGLWRMVTDVGGDSGTPSLELKEVMRWFGRWNKKMKGHNFIESVNHIMAELPVRELTRDHKYRAFKNGLWTYTSMYDGFLTPWEDVDPSLTFTTKIPHNIRTEKVLAEPVIIEPDGTEWTWTKQLQSIFSTDEECNGWMEVITASLDPKHDYKSFILMADGTSEATGNNGKSTLLEVIIYIQGGADGGQITVLPLAHFAKDFALEPAINTGLIVSHENSETEQIPGEAIANLKAIATKNEVTIGRKFKTAISMKIDALVIQAFNVIPSFGKTAGNFERREKTFLFKNCFTGREKTYIAEDYLKREEVIEYILWYCIHKVGNITQLTDYDFYKESLEFFKTNTEPVARFIVEVLNQKDYIKNAFISRPDLYQYYRSWYLAEYGNTTKCVARNTFWKLWEVNKKYLNGWEYDTKTVRIPKLYKPVVEPFINDYRCVKAMDEDVKRLYHVYDETSYELGPTAEAKSRLCTPSIPASRTLHGYLHRSDVVFDQESA